MYLNEKILSTSKTDRRAQFPKKCNFQRTKPCSCFSPTYLIFS